MISRRHFIKTSALGSTALTGGFRMANAFAIGDTTPALYTLSNQLLEQWAQAVLRLQVTNRSVPENYGGIYCPADTTVHGRSGDTIYPLLHLAAKKKESRYLDAATLLYRWMETRVSQPDGSWLNEPVAGSWKGTTVFAAISLAEAVKHHGTVLDNTFKTALTDRLNKAGQFIYDNIHIKYGNINYPVTAAYGMSLLGEVLDHQPFRERGKSLAYETMAFFTKKDQLLYGEGDITHEPSAKGCLAIDLGYNVEESLPALVQYGLLNKDNTILETVTRSMQQHLAFMLPDGAWDNSWGTRNYKWTYWGSRTSDGCQTAYALLADRDPRFYKAAWLNTKLMQQCTHEGLLTGGPHYHKHGVTPCVHHTFSHMKALTTVLDHAHLFNKQQAGEAVVLPREKEYGVHFFEDIQTWLVSKGQFRATVTAYDKEYKQTRNGHATGGALSMLWHGKTGPLVCAGMNEYQLYEAGNMQRDTDPLSMPLTPRAELQIDGKTYLNISDLKAVVEVIENRQAIIVTVHSKLVDKDQKDPLSGPLACTAIYRFSGDKVLLELRCEKTIYSSQVRIILPVIATSAEKIDRVSDSVVQISKNNGTVRISASHSLHQAPVTGSRLFSFVPGFEAMPFLVKGDQAKFEIAVL